MDTTSRPKPTRRERVLAIIVFAVVLVSSLLTLIRFPEPHVDEVVWANIFTNFSHTGRFTNTLVGDLYGLNQATARNGRLFILGLGSFFKVFGTRLFSARLFSMAGWLLAVVMIYLIGRDLFDGTTGLTAAVVFALASRPYIYSHYARSDIWTAATTLCVVYHFLRSRRHPTPARFFVLGLLMLWPVEQHLIAVWMLLPVGILVVVENYRTRQGRLLIGTYALGSVLAVVAFWMLQFQPDPALAMEQIRPGSASYGGLQSSGLLERVIWLGAMYIGGLFIQYNSPGLFYSMLPGMILYAGYALFGLSSALIRRSDADRRLLALWGLSLLTFTFGMAHKNPAYAVIWDPYLALFIGVALVGAGGLRDRLPVLCKVSTTALVAPLVIMSLLGRLVLAGIVWSYDYAAYEDQLAGSVPPGGHLMAPGPMWYTFQETSEFTADWYFATWSCHRESPLNKNEMATLLGNLEVDYVIDQGRLDTLFDCSNLLPPDASEDYKNLLEESCTIVEEVDKPTFPGGGYDAESLITTIYDCRGAFND